MYQLNESILENELNYFLCSYGEDASDILFDKSFQPESFTVYEKMTGKNTIYFRDVPFDEWCKGLIIDQVSKIKEVREKDLLIKKTMENTLFLLSHEINNELLATKIYNQEFVDIVRRVITFTIYGTFSTDVYTAKEFNELSYRILPKLLEQINPNSIDLKELFLMSVASGMMGLDLKGAPAASSNYANPGIPMKKYINMSPSAVAVELLQELKSIANNSDTPIFYWDYFIESIKNASQIVWMTDDYIESFFDLLIIQKIVEINPSICVDIIPKNGRFGNDLAWTDLESILQLSIYKRLNDFIKHGQITINHYGPQMGAANLRKLSKPCIDSIKRADFVVTKGCRIHEMIQGGINKRLFSAYIVTRELSQLVTGFSSEKTPILLMFAEPGEFLFWGVNQGDMKKCFNEKKSFELECCSTIKEHEYRKTLVAPQEIVAEFNKLYQCLSHYLGLNRSVCQELQLLAKRIALHTQKSYSANHHLYGQIHRSINELDKQSWDFLIQSIDNRGLENCEILEVGAGNGKDLIYGASLGFKMIGCDNCIEFVDCFNDEVIDDTIEYHFGDINNLPFDDMSFSIVRCNASLVHIPIIDIGYGVDLAISECHRVLKKNGILFLLLKKGNGVQVTDTGEGLGERIFQYYDKESLYNILKRNHFGLIADDIISESRKGKTIEWIACVAERL